MCVIALGRLGGPASHAGQGTLRDIRARKGSTQAPVGARFGGGGVEDAEDVAHLARALDDLLRVGLADLVPLLFHRQVDHELELRLRERRGCADKELERLERLDLLDRWRRHRQVDGLAAAVEPAM